MRVIGNKMPPDFQKRISEGCKLAWKLRKAEREQVMTRYQQKVLRCFVKMPGAGPCNVCDVLGAMEPLDVHNANRAIVALERSGWLKDGDLTPMAEKWLEGHPEK